MALEKISATQVVTWEPALPQRAFPILAAGSTTDNMGSGGTATDGKRYGWFTLSTAQWGVEEGFHTPPVTPGEKFQVFSSANAPYQGAFLNPPAFDNGTVKWSDSDVNSSGGAPDLFAVSALTGSGRPSSGYSAAAASAVAAFTVANLAASAAAAAFHGLGSTPGALARAALSAIAAASVALAASKSAAANVYTASNLADWNKTAVAYQAAAAAALAAATQAVTYGDSAVATDFSTAASAYQAAATAAIAAAVAASATVSRDGVPVGLSPLWTLLNPNVCTIASVQQASSGAWSVYFSPNLLTTDTVVPGRDGIITVPQPSSPRYLGSIGHVNALNYTYSVPGGPDQLTCHLAIEPTFRTDALNPGRIVTAHRGGSCVWEGQLTEPVPAADGITLTANGVGTYGTNFGAWWDENLPKGAGWTSDAPVDFAISRGLRWVNRGIGKPAGIYTGPVQDPGSMTVTDFLNLLCTGGALTWTLTQPAGASSWPPAPWELRVFAMPTDISGNPLAAGPSAKVQTEIFVGGWDNQWKRIDLLTTKPRRPPDLFLVNTSPVARTIVADYNTIIIYYEATPDKTATSTKAAVAATYATTFADVPGSVAAHGRMEYYLDVSNAGAMTKAAAQGIGLNVLNKYIRANFAGAFAVMPGQLLNPGGVPVDLGVDWSGAMCAVQGVNEAFGGEVGMAPITFLIGQYAYDDVTQTAQVTPYQNARTDLASVIAALYPGRFA